MIKAYSQRLLPPYSGQAQIAESERGRAVTMDGELWEFHFLYGANDDKIHIGNHAKRRFRRVAYIHQASLSSISQEKTQDGQPIDERILELAEFLTTANLPFPAADKYEYWLLDPKDGLPLALIFSCTEAEYMATYPLKTEWTALPDAVMHIEKTPDEQARSAPPVNYRFETLIAERAGYNPCARWFTRNNVETEPFPAFMVREDWQDEEAQQLCQRYLQRQSPRLLMLHDLTLEERKRMELAAKAHALEVQRFYPLYPAVADEPLMNAIRVEARLRNVTMEEDSPIHQRRDGVLYL